MKLDGEWRSILRYAWSVRLMVVAGVFAGLQAALPIVNLVVYIPQGLFAGLTGVVVCAALVSRFIAQRDLKS